MSAGGVAISHTRVRRVSRRMAGRFAWARCWTEALRWPRVTQNAWLPKGSQVARAHRGYAACTRSRRAARLQRVRRKRKLTRLQRTWREAHSRTCVCGSEGTRVGNRPGALALQADGFRLTRAIGTRGLPYRKSAVGVAHRRTRVRRVSRRMVGRLAWARSRTEASEWPLGAQNAWMPKGSQAARVQRGYAAGARTRRAARLQRVRRKWSLKRLQRTWREAHSRTCVCGAEGTQVGNRPGALAPQADGFRLTRAIGTRVLPHRKSAGGAAHRRTRVRRVSRQMVGRIAWARRRTEASRWPLGMQNAWMPKGSQVARAHRMRVG